MKYKKISYAIIISFVLISCQKEKILGVINNDYVSLKSSPTIQSLDKYPWEGRTSKFITDENSDIIYLGAILNGQELIQNENYIPIVSYTKLPIKITGTFNVKAMAGITLERPRLSTYRQKIRDLFYEDPNIIQSGGFEFVYRPFTSYDSLNNEFTTSKKTSKFFSSSSSSITNIQKNITKKTGLVLQFIQTYYTTTMNLPRRGELISRNSVDSMLNVNMNPMYVNSMTYGRMGVIAVESNNSFEELSSVYNSVSRKLFKRETESITQHEVNVVNESTIYIYIIGGNGSVGSLPIIGYNHLASIITNGDIQPSTDNPGVPISFTMRYLRDFSPVAFTY